jgi:tetratricopeptide (TPR) repeat protein
MDNEESKIEVINYIEKASVVLLGLLFILFPLLFTNLTTDFYSIPKQALLIFTVIILMLLFAGKTFLTEKVSIRRTPFDLPIVLFVLATLLSVVFSVSKWDSLTNFVPFLFAGLSFFAITYNVKNEKSLLLLAGSLLVGGTLTSLVSLLSYFKVYVFPFDFTKAQIFSTIGGYYDLALYLSFLLPLALYLISPFILKRSKRETQTEKKMDLIKLLLFGLSGLIILGGLILSAINLIKSDNLVLLPMETGFQTAFAAISQDSGRVLQGLLFGSGFGQYLTDFTRFKQASFNTDPNLWSLTFIRSSSFVLELLATTGLLGLLSYLFLCFKVVREKPLFVPLIIALAISFVLPLSFITLTLIFFLFGLYSGLKGLTDNQKYFDVELQLVTLKKGFFAFALEEKAKSRSGNKVLSYLVLSIFVVFALVFGFGTYNYLAANITFEKSLVAASQNNGQLTYTYQNSALSTLTGRNVDAYHRIFSQTNLALANSIASSVPQGASPSAQTTQTIYTLVQQSINAAREATALAPKNAINWQNLASIYRALIGFGQNAESFAVVAQQQAVVLDPFNPQEYIALGGIFYQLGAYDRAQEQFQKAVDLKPDYANAYYNLGHAQEQRGDLQAALTQYQTVKTLVANDKDNLDLISKEIAALEARIGQANAGSQNNSQAQSQDTQLGIPTPSAALPKQNPPVRIPGPSETPTPTPTGGPTPTPTIAPELNP